MDIKKIRKYIKGNFTPTRLPGRYGDERELYCCSATLLDGTLLPCIVVQESEHRVQNAVDMFKARAKDKDPFNGYRATVEGYVCSGNQLSYLDIKELRPSVHAIPSERLREIQETAMGYIAFTAIMDDDKQFTFATCAPSPLFFEMPKGYSGSRMKKIICADRANLEGFSGAYQAKPYFDCYLSDPFGDYEGDFEKRLLETTRDSLRKAGINRDLPPDIFDD